MLERVEASVPTESSPLVGSQNDDPAEILPQKTLPESFPVLLDIIGCRNLPVSKLSSYCVVQYGTKTIHRTRKFVPRVSKVARISQVLQMNALFGYNIEERSLRNPIWTIHDDSLQYFHVTRKDLRNKKSLQITVWGQPGKLNLRDHAANVVVPQRKIQQLESIGKIQIAAPLLLEQCTEDRLEVQLRDELGNGIVNSDGEPALLAYRLRIASKADLVFVDKWLSTRNANDWKEVDALTEAEKPHASLITELPERLIKFPRINAALPPKGHIRIKPYPDPGSGSSNSDYITPVMLKTQTQLLSRKWIQAGSNEASLGRIYLEILSAHDLPNVDIGGSIGNRTDAFCAIIYGDSMVQTDVIFDELNPHWPCWSQRAFVLSVQHPSQVLYLSLFGFKRNPLPHRAIGRVEINPLNLQNGTMHSLEYDLCGLSHASKRHSRGRIKLRMRVEIEDERKFLFAALRLPPPVYINVKKRKSFNVARYTACGEHDNKENFSLQVLQGYIDEIIEEYVRRALYAFQDGAKSLLLWRDQIVIGGMGFPLYSFLCFLMACLALEVPRLLPSFLCFVCALVLLQQMQQRVSSPSPWRRCFSFSHYLRILLLGKSTAKYRTILADEGFDKLQSQESAMKKRIDHDKRFLEKKDAIEREIEEIENFEVRTKSTVIPVEMIVVLGKIQGIVGGLCRVCRLFDAIITWEASDISFFITFALLLAGFFFMLIPWGFLLRWLGRIFVVLLLGPQNKLLDLLWFQNVPTDEQKIYQIFAERMFQARCMQEEAGKLKAFRNLLFGKYATLVPPLFWTPHMDFPRPSSTAYGGGLAGASDNIAPKIPSIVGQQLFGKMIPRSEIEWRQNYEESKDMKKLMDAVMTVNKRTGSTIDWETTFVSPEERDSSLVPEEEGFEVTEMFHDEAAFVRRAFTPKDEESLCELGIEIFNSRNNEISTRYSTTWNSIHDFSDRETDSDDSLSNSESELGTFHAD